MSSYCCIIIRPFRLLTFYNMILLPNLWNWIIFLHFTLLQIWLPNGKSSNLGWQLPRNEDDTKRGRMCFWMCLRHRYSKLPMLFLAVWRHCMRKSVNEYTSKQIQLIVSVNSLQKYYATINVLWNIPLSKIFGWQLIC